MAANAANPRPRTVHKQTATAAYPCPRTIHVRAQSAPTGAVTNCPHPRTHHSYNSPWASIGSGQKLSADSPQSRTVHVGELVAHENSPRTAIGKELSAPALSRFRAVSSAFRGSYPNYSFICPPLIPPQSARRSRHLRPAVRRISRTCFLRRISSQSCSRSGHPCRRVAENRRRCFSRFLQLFLTIRPCVFST